MNNVLIPFNLQNRSWKQMRKQAQKGKAYANHGYTRQHSWLKFYLTVNKVRISYI